MPPTPTTFEPLPTASQAVAWIASALRFSDLRSGNGAVSEATTKRIAAGAATVSGDKTAALVNRLVDGLFSEHHMRARGLDASEAADHRAVTIAGFEGALAVWDRFTAMANHGEGRGRGATIPVLGVLFFEDFVLRLAAYVALYGTSFPELRRHVDRGGKSVVEALAQIRARSHGGISDGALIEAARIDRNTLRDLRKGARLPREETILAVAAGLAKLGIRNGDRGATVHDLEFELRLGCLFSSLGTALAADSDLHEVVTFEVGTLRFYVSDLRRYTRSELAEIVAQGVRWPRWREAHARMSEALAADLGRMLDAVKANADRWGEQLAHAAEKDPSASLRMMAERFRSFAVEMRASISEVPGGARSSAADYTAFLESLTDYLSALAEGREHPDLPAFGDTFRAKSLCNQAMAPWLGSSDAKELYQSAVELDPACAYVRFWYAGFLANIGQSQEARRHLDVAVMLDESYDEARLLLAEVLVRERRHGDALVQLELLEARGSVTADLLVVRGHALLGLGEAARADETFELALGIAPLRPEAHAGRARALRALGDVAGAKRYEQSAGYYAGERPPRPTAIRR